MPNNSPSGSVKKQSKIHYYSPNLTSSEDLGAPISRAEMQISQAFKSASYWKEVAEAAALFAARIRSTRRPTHLLRDEVASKYGEEAAGMAEQLIDKADKEQ